MVRTQNATFRSFVDDDSGAVTVDWVVLTAALVGLGLAVMAVVSGGVEDLANDTDTALMNTEISDSFGSALSDWARQQWEANNPGIYDSYSTWMAGFTDDNLLAHYNNIAQWANMPPGSGHPYDTYHDEFWIARDELISRGLIAPDAPIPGTV